MEETIKKLEKIVADLKKYREDTYTCDMCNNAKTPVTDYPCNDCKRSYKDYFTLRVEGCDD